MRKPQLDANDRTILRARDATNDMIERLIAIAKMEPSSHISVKAAEAVIRIGREPTSMELGPPSFQSWRIGGKGGGQLD